MYYPIRFFRLLIVALTLVGCGSGGGDPGAVTEYSYTYDGSGYGIDLLDTPETDTASATFRYTVNLGSNPRDLFFIFTNVTQSPAADYPALTRDTATTPSSPVAAEPPVYRMRTGRTSARGRRGRPDISRFNNNPGESFAVPAVNYSYSMLSSAPLPTKDTVGGAAIDFYPENSATPVVSATCRQIVTAGGKTLNVWVADSAWDAGSGCSEPNCVTQTMVDTLADKFLKTGNDNDIHDWVGNIFGAEWGPHSLANLIDPATDNITILLFDIDADDSTNGGVLGYFHAKDNFTKAAQPYSNERLMFYLDSVLYAEMDGISWEISDYWPSEIIGALAHEFQHMIHFYQKLVVNNLDSSAIWMNEMASEMAEEFVATKAAIDGPRGVAWNDPTAGSSWNYNGLLPRFNRYDYITLSDWMSGGINDFGDSNVLNSYSVNYAFGAFLARNFAGAALFQNMVRNDKTDQSAIDDALTAAGFNGENFASVLRKWGVAVLLSDDASAAVPVGYRYNTGGFINTTMNSVTYDLGSINLSNYVFGSQIGPVVYTSLPPVDTSAGKYKASNMYYLVGSGLTGSISRNITLPKGVKLTAVVK